MKSLRAAGLAVALATVALAAFAQSPLAYPGSTPRRRTRRPRDFPVDDLANCHAWILFQVVQQTVNADPYQHLPLVFGRGQMSRTAFSRLPRPRRTSSRS